MVSQTRISYWAKVHFVKVNSKVRINIISSFSYWDSEETFLKLALFLLYECNT